MILINKTSINDTEYKLNLFITRWKGTPPALKNLSAKRYNGCQKTIKKRSEEKQHCEVICNMLYIVRKRAKRSSILWYLQQKIKQMSGFQFTLAAPFSEFALFWDYKSFVNSPKQVQTINTRFEDYFRVPRNTKTR